MPTKLQVFLSHNSADKPLVEILAERLAQESDLDPWLDKWNLIPGQPWQEELERVITNCYCCVVFVGKNGLGPWHHEEMRSLISRRVSNRDQPFRVIPVLLPGAERSSRSTLPPFLVATTYVEFRQSLEEAEAWRRLLAGIRGQKPGRPGGQAQLATECPYRGLEYFDVQHADRFFGREAITQWLVDDVRKLARPQNDQPRFIGILGASGSGKSSLARAGLVAALQKGALEGSDRWVFVSPFRPGPNPLESLELEVRRASATSPQLANVGEELRGLATNPDRLHRAARMLVPETTPPSRLFLLVDQFEELFTLCENDEVRRAFIATLLYAARVPDGPVIVALTMRADFYPKVAAYEELARVMDQHQFLVGPMNVDELRLAIEEPALRAGAEFQPGLVDALLEDVHRQPGALPLLQHALVELWNERQEGHWLTHEAYKKIGGLEGALERRANQILGEFSAADQELCRRMFLRLVQPGEGTEDTKRRASLTELMSGTDGARIQFLVQSLAAKDSRLIVTEGAGPEQAAGTFVEVAHEALIRSWSQLRKWIEADRAGHRTLRRMSDAAYEWNEGKRRPDFLYTGARLVVAAEWADHHPGELNQLDQEFLQASRQAQKDDQARELQEQRERTAALEQLSLERERAAQLDRARAEAAELATREAVERVRDREQAAIRSRRLLKFVTALGVAAGALAIAASVSLWYTNRANDRAKAETEKANRAAGDSQAQALVAEAWDTETSAPERSVLLAAAAVRTIRHQSSNEFALPRAHRKLSDALTAMHGRPVAGGNSTAFSSDEQWIATSSTGTDGNIAQLFRLGPDGLTTNFFLLRGHSNLITALAFSPNNQWLVTASADNTARVWSLTTNGPATTSFVLRGHTNWIPAVVVSPDSRWIITGSADNLAFVWRLETNGPAGEPWILRGHTNAIHAVAVTDKWIVTGSADKTARLWKLTENGPATNSVSLEGHTDAVYAVAVSGDGRRLVTGSWDNTARIWDLEALNPAGQSRLLRGHTMPIVAVAIDNDGQWVVTGGDDQSARFWRLDPNRALADTPIDLFNPPGHEARVTTVAISPDGQWAVTGSEDNTARLRILNNEGPSTNSVVLPVDEGPVVAAAFSAKSRWLVTSSSAKAARLWALGAGNLGSQAQPTHLQHPESAIKAIAVGGRKPWISTGGDDNTVKLWEVSTNGSPSEFRSFSGPANWITGVALSPDGRWLVAASEDHTARLWEVSAPDSAASPFTLGPLSGRTNLVSISGNGDWIATGSDDGTAWLWKLGATPALSRPLALPRHRQAITALALSSDGKWVVTASADKTAILTKLSDLGPTGKPFQLTNHTKSLNAVAISPNDHWVLTGSADYTARLWRLPPGDPGTKPVVLSGHSGAINAVTFTADSTWAVTGSADHTARLWDLRGAEQNPPKPQLLRGHSRGINAVVITPDQRWLITGSDDRTARLWDLAAIRNNNVETRPIVLRGQESPIVSLSVSPDSRWMVSRTVDGMAGLWFLNVDDLVAIARRVVGRNLTTNEWKSSLPDRDYFPVFPELPVRDR